MSIGHGYPWEKRYDMKKKIVIGTLILLAVSGICVAGMFINNRKTEGMTEAQDEVMASHESVPDEMPDDTVAAEEGSGESVADEITESSAETETKPVQIAGENRYGQSAYLLDAAYEQMKGKNTLVSPLSLNMALGLVSEGAVGETRQEILDYLNTNDYSRFANSYMQGIARYNVGEEQEENNDSDEGLSTFGDMISPIGLGGYRQVYDIANSIWVDQKETLKESFATKIQENYNAQTEVVDFKNNRGEAAEKINSWVDEKTRHMIPLIVEEDDLDEKTPAVIVNSLYFESPWVEKWAYKKKHVFTDFAGNKTEKDLLGERLGTYFENEYATGFSKSYMNGMEFIGILPKQTGEFSLSELDLESLLDSRTFAYDVDVIMPELDYGTNVTNLSDILKQQGIHKAFDEEQADFSDMVELKNDERVFISKIIQSCKIELDQYGTKAAAATAVVFEKTTCVMDEREVKQVYMERPFAYIIYDRDADQILFAGKVVSVE